jgi:hypothetical protein
VIAGRDKDLAFLREAAKHRMADPEILLRRLKTVQVDSAIPRQAHAAIERIWSGWSG